MSNAGSQSSASTNAAFIAKASTRVEGTLCRDPRSTLELTSNGIEKHRLGRARRRSSFATLLVHIYFGAIGAGQTIGSGRLMAPFASLLALTTAKTSTALSD